MSSDISWKDTRNHYRRNTNLVFLGIDDRLKCLFVKTPPLSAEFSLADLDWETDYFELDVAAVANQLLAINYQSFFSALSEINWEFRQKYPVPRATWLSAASKEGYLSERVDFERTVFASMEGRDTVLTKDQRDEDAIRFEDNKFFRSKLIEKLGDNSEVELSYDVQDLFLHLNDFAFCDDLWLCRNQNMLADSFLFHIWGKECSYIAGVFEEVANMTADAPGLFDASSAFDYAIGIRFFQRGDLTRFLEEMDIRTGRSFVPFKNLSHDDKKPLSDLARDYRSSNSMNAESVGAAICGALIRECSRLSNDRFWRFKGIGELKSRLALYYCASAPEKVALFREIQDKAKEAETSYAVYEAGIGRSGVYSRLSSLHALLDIADSFFRVFYCEAAPAECFKKDSGSFAMRSECFLPPNYRSNRGTSKGHPLGIKLVAIKNALSGVCWDLSVQTFPGFLAHFLSAAFRFGLSPRHCKRCGGLFFPEAPNQQYCQRIVSETGVRCSAIVRNEKEQYNKAKKSVAAKAVRAESKNQEIKKYYEDLSCYIQYEAGPLYMHSEYVDRVQYSEWLKEVIGPKYGSAVSMRPFERPYCMVWGKRVLKGTEWVYISTVAEMILNSNNEMFEPLIWENLHGRVSGWRSRVRAAVLFRCVLAYNKSHLGEELPVPGLTESPFYKLVEVSGDEIPEPSLG